MASGDSESLNIEDELDLDLLCIEPTKEFCALRIKPTKVFCSDCKANHSTSISDPKIKHKTSKQKLNRYYKQLDGKRKLLPIWPYKDIILETIKSSQIVVVEGESGVGKSSQVPRWCLELPGVKQIVCTQPKKMDAINLAQRVAKEMKVKMGQEVGFVVPFDRKDSAKTVLKFVTDGILFRQAMQDRTLSCYDVIIIDEAHERKLLTDILLAIIRDILPLRSDMKIIIMCAFGMDTFCEFFNPCSHISIQNKINPVEIVPCPDYESKSEFALECNYKFPHYVYDAINLILEICFLNKNIGDILVFVTGRDQINFICKNITEIVEKHKRKYSIGNIDVIPFHANLPYAVQKRAFGPSPPSSPGKIGRKCIVSTNLAEKVSINGITFVIDSGMVKISHSDTHLMSHFRIEISKAIADQRANKAGKTHPGTCYRLYTKMLTDFIPEIVLCDPSDTILQMKAVGIDLEKFGWLTKPSPKRVEQVINNLKLLGAIDAKDEITPVGKQMARFPVDVTVARMLVASEFYGCQEEIITLAAMLSVEKPNSTFIFCGDNKCDSNSVQKPLHHPSGDHLTLINVYGAFILNNCSEKWCKSNYINYQVVSEARRIRDQIVLMMIELRLLLPSTKVSTPATLETIMKAILTGISGNIAQDSYDSVSYRARYITVRGGLRVELHPTSAVSFYILKDLFCYSSCITHNNKDKFLHIATAIEEEWYDDVRASQKANNQPVQAPALKRPVIVYEKVTLFDLD